MKMECSSILGRQSDYLSIENTNCLKGIYAIGVLIHHLYQHSGLLREGYLRYLGGCLQALGFFMVAVFFFLSGYGLFQSTRYNKALAGFAKKKILPFYLIIVFYTLVYVVYKIVCGSKIEWLSIVHSLTFGGTIIANGWYLQVQLLCYLVFFFVMKYVDERYQILTMSAVQIIYIVICLLVGASSLFYERAFIFVMGMMWAKYKIQIDNWLSDRIHFGFALLLSATSFVGLYGLSYVALTALFRGLSYFPFVVFTILLVKIIPINFKIIGFLGKISLEIYVLQGLFLNLFHSEICRIENPYICFGCMYMYDSFGDAYASGIKEDLFYDKKSQRN